MWDEKPPHNHKTEEKCLMVDIVTARQKLASFYKYGFEEILSSVPQNRLAEIISSLAMKGNQSKTTDFAELKHVFRTTYGHFLSKGKWDEQAVSQKQQERSFQKTAELGWQNMRPST